MADATGAGEAGIHPRPFVRDFRQILLWPIQLLPPAEGAQSRQQHGERLARLGGPWEEIADEFTEDVRDFQERHYAEFVTFMPDVQRFLYGEAAGAAYGASPIRVFRRRDVATARAQFRPGETPVEFTVARVELYFFYDIDLAIMAVELLCHDLSLAQAQDALFRLGRAYPTTWAPDGGGTNCCARISLHDADGAELAASDYEHKARYLAQVCRHRTPRIAAHWQYLMHPLTPDEGPESAGQEGADGGIRFRPLEHQRIPVLGCLAVADPAAIAREDWIRLGLLAPPGDAGVTPFAPAFLADFESRHCYDRFWDADGRHDQIVTRMLCSGQAFVMVGDAGDPRYTDVLTGITCQFRHQYFLLGLIAHFHRAALLIFRDRLVTAISGLADYAPETVKRFKRAVRLTHENFLRFAHRYWFQELSNQAPARDLFAMWTGHLGSNQLFAEVRQEVLDMIDYLDSDSLRRQANTVVRLTVVTFFGLIMSLTVGFLGAELINIDNRPAHEKAMHFLIVIVPMAAFIFYTAKKSHRLAEFVDAISDERQSIGYKLQAFVRIWKRKR
ncbi:hypothetical protein [Caenibius sp. WL]|uniref:hypothetical protein n=1 Tax=Caenibius sp. WL TaxID=2872646 RepID=UPI001C99B797|nr:hypothetical protein [Caenibius sp. WL]QZP08098.1 hypothetical protein K5X80_15915 [Caenibius sp. WL]